MQNSIGQIMVKYCSSILVKYILVKYWSNIGKMAPAWCCPADRIFHFLLMTTTLLVYYSFSTRSLTVQSRNSSIRSTSIIPPASIPSSLLLAAFPPPQFDSFSLKAFFIGLQSLFPWHSRLQFEWSNGGKKAPGTYGHCHWRASP